MKTIISTTAAFVLLATAAALGDEAPPPQPKVQQAGDSAKEAEDCSKQVWPHFSEACLRSESKGIPVRLVTTERRQRTADFAAWIDPLRSTVPSRVNSGNKW